MNKKIIEKLRDIQLLKDLLDIKNNKNYKIEIKGIARSNLKRFRNYFFKHKTYFLNLVKLICLKQNYLNKPLCSTEKMSS